MPSQKELVEVSYLICVSYRINRCYSNLCWLFFLSPSPLSPRGRFGLTTPQTVATSPARSFSFKRKFCVCGNDS
ncbi:hypothetical protein CRE_29404 [Caenorhabditis remanei]|uniref:Uncharacterized protein n=1 Tax=Caenorhabditis remanei TaxID=31234 RepID=E3NVW2_CAERE|nr:hypothetical protein CRE_29404 [Caenorhabditis remanei]